MVDAVDIVLGKNAADEAVQLAGGGLIGEINDRAALNGVSFSWKATRTFWHKGTRGDEGRLERYTVDAPSLWVCA